MSLIEQPPRFMENPGRSGAKLFVSYDRKLVIKSITSEEVALVHQILQPYHAVRTLALINPQCPCAARVTVARTFVLSMTVLALSAMRWTVSDTNRACV